MSNVYIYSRGSYENLSQDFLSNKVIIRIHNIRDEKWYPIEEENKLVLFFNDIKMDNLSFMDKFKANLGFKTKHLNKILAIKIVNYIKANKDKDFVIHCEYGRSRSVAVALFLKENLNYTIANKKDNELTKYNDWVLLLLKKNY